MDEERITLRKAVCLVLFLLAVIGVGSCGSRDELTDRSVLTGLPCAPPCWQGITPGVTDRGQALEILQNSPYVRRGSLRESGTVESGGVVWEGQYHSPYAQPSLWWEHDVVQEITMYFSYDLSIEQIVSKFGPPEAINAGRGGLPEHYYWSVILYYPRTGVEFHALTEEFSDLLTPSTKVELGRYFTPTSLEQRIRTVYGSYTSAEKLIAFEMSIMRPWKGYGDLFQLYYKSPDELFLP